MNQMKLVMPISELDLDMLSLKTRGSSEVVSLEQLYI